MPTGCFYVFLPGNLSPHLPYIGLFPVVELSKTISLASCHTCLASCKSQWNHSLLCSEEVALEDQPALLGFSALQERFL